MSFPCLYFFFFFNDTATTEIYTLSLHDALPICGEPLARLALAEVVDRVRHRPERLVGLTFERHHRADRRGVNSWAARVARDRKSTRLNSSHSPISYAVFCLKKKK